MTVAPAVADKGLMTAEEFLLLPDDDMQRELVRGDVVEKMPSGGRHSVVGGDVHTELNIFVRAARSGVCPQADAGFVLSRDPDTVRSPDAAYVSHERLGPHGVPTGFFQCAPDLAVEVVSPSDRPGEIMEKVRDYIQAGTRLFWVIDPEKRMATVWRADSTVSFISETGVLSGEDVLPGFDLALASVLP